MMSLVLSIIWCFLSVFPANAELAQSDYMVGDGDVLKISVYDNPDLDTVVRIQSDGTIQFPLVGQVDLSGMSVVQVAERIEAALAAGYLVNPQASVFIQEYRSQRVIIMGHVKNPGVYKLSGQTHLLELISMAGGLLDNAGDKLIINRKVSAVGDETKNFDIDLRKLLEAGDSSLNVPIRDQDSIFITKSGMFYVTGEVGKPAGYKLEERTTVLKAISMAGGFTKIASKGKVRVLRTIAGQEQVIENVSMQQPVMEEDIIIVPESFF